MKMKPRFPQVVRFSLAVGLAGGVLALWAQMPPSPASAEPVSSKSAIPPRKPGGPKPATDSLEGRRKNRALPITFLTAGSDVK